METDTTFTPDEKIKVIIEENQISKAEEEPVQPCKITEEMNRDKKMRKKLDNRGRGLAMEIQPMNKSCS